MGRYSRKDMIEFAKFAKSYISPRDVEKAYAAYLKGARLNKPDTKKSPIRLLQLSNIAYLDGKILKNRYGESEISPPIYDFTVEVESWDAPERILRLRTIEVKPLTEGKTKSNIKQYPNGVPMKKGMPPPSSKPNKTI